MGRALANLSSFAGGGYEVDDQDLSTRGEVVIWAHDSLTPRLGDLFTVESGGRTHEVTVDVVTTYRDGWSVTCRVLGLRA
jgi:hypothetical protein